MNGFTSIKPLPWLLAAMLAGVLAGCGGGDDDGGPAPRPPQAAAIGNIAGDWTITETQIDSSEPACTPDGGNPLATYPVTIAQTDTSSNLTVTDSTNPSNGPATFNGTLHGPTLRWGGSFQERGGTTTFNSVNITVANDCNTASGTYSWTYVQDPATATFTCTATTKVDAARNTPVTSCTPPTTPPASSS